MSQREALKRRAVEAADIIQRAIDSGWSIGAIAEAVRVNKRQIYRWYRDGAGPHPIMLDGLRRLDEKVASRRR